MKNNFVKTFKIYAKKSVKSNYIKSHSLMEKKQSHRKVRVFKIKKKAIFYIKIHPFIEKWSLAH